MSSLPVAAATPETPRRDARSACLSIILPAFNEGLCIDHTMRVIVEALSPHVGSWEILVVDDGSSDNTCEVVRQAPEAYRARLIKLSRNFGKEAALSAGLDQAVGDMVVCMDSDGQHPTDLVVKMLALWQDGIDMVYAVRRDRDSETRFKKFGSQLFYSALSASGEVSIPPDAGDFRLMDRCVVEALKALPERTRFMKGLYAWVGFRTMGIDYVPLPRSHGVSHYSKRKLVQLAWTGFTGFSAMPLRISSALGLVLAVLALAYGAEVVFEYFFFSRAVPGWPTIVVSIMFFSGVQLMFIGILGEYLARVYDEVKGRPKYIVAEATPPLDRKP